MTESTHATILRRMTRAHAADVVENPLTSSRAVRLALTKAANDAAGLVLTVSSVAEEVNDLDAMLAGLPDGIMLVGLQRSGQLVGLIALDMQLRAAVLEMETMGVLSGQVADDRAPTQTDKVMCDPLLAGFLAAFPDAVRSTALEGWGDHVTHEARIADTRAAGLLLADVSYRLLQMDVQLGTTDRQGVLLMMLPFVEAVTEKPAPVPPLTPDWATEFTKVINDAPASLTALLHRFSIPLATAQKLHVGMVLQLPGCRVSSVKLIAADAKVVAQAKLGQSGGMRAVRIEAAPLPDLHDLDTAAAVIPMPEQHVAAQGDLGAAINDMAPMAPMSGLDDDPAVGSIDDEPAFGAAPMFADAADLTPN